MSVRVRIEVTAELIAAAGEKPAVMLAPAWSWSAWADPVEAAIKAVTGVDVDVDGGDFDRVCVATIGTREGATLVVDLPDAANDWLDDRWGGSERAPFGFDLELPDWLVELCRGAA